MQIKGKYVILSSVKKPWFKEHKKKPKTHNKRAKKTISAKYCYFFLIIIAIIMLTK